MRGLRLDLPLPGESYAMLAALRNPRLWPWLIIVPGGIILRAWGVDLSPLWYDESFTRLMAGLPLDRLLIATSADVHPPLYYFLVWGLELLGNTAFTLRMFSVICSSAALAMFWPLSGHFRLSHGARLVALAIMAFHPNNLYYAQEARMYALLQFLVIMQILALLTDEWALLALYTLCALYTHNYGLIYTALIGLLALIRYLQDRSPRKLLMLVAGIALPGLLWLPWSAVLLRQMSMVASGYWIAPITPGSIIQDMYLALVGYGVPPALTLAAFYAMVAGLTLIILYGVDTRRWDLLLLGVGPLALAAAVSLAWKPIMLYRGFTAIIPFLALLAGGALACDQLAVTQPGPVTPGSHFRARAVGLALLLPLAAASIWQIGANYNGEIKHTPLVPIPATAWPVIHLDDTTLILTGRPDRDYLLDAGCPGEGGALSHTTRAMLGFRTISLSQLPDRFLFSALIGPLTTKCHEDVFRAITANMPAVYTHSDQMREWGVWYAAR